MSRSYRKTPIHGVTTACSEKDDKRIIHGMMRAAERDALSNLNPDHLENVSIPQKMRELYNVWNMAKDGRWLTDRTERPRRDRRGGFIVASANDDVFWPAHRCWGK